MSDMQTIAKKSRTKPGDVLFQLRCDEMMLRRFRSEAALLGKSTVQLITELMQKFIKQKESKAMRRAS